MSTKKRSFRIAVALTLAVVTAVPALAKEKAKDFDFKKTSAFIREMESRPDFPVATMLANDYVYSLLAMGEKIDNGRQNAIILSMKLAQLPNGGISPGKGDRGSSILYTDIALETLGLLNATDAVDLAKVKSFAASLKNGDGGFGFSREARGSSLATTYHAVRVLKAVRGLDLVDRTKTVAYVKRFAKDQGGFGPEEGAGIANARSTYMAAYVLNALGGLDGETVRKSVRFLEKTPYLDRKNKQRRELDEQLYAIRALKELKAAGRVDRSIALSFMKRLYIRVNGGFGPMEGYGSTPDSTTTALRILAEVGRVKGPGVLTAQR